MNAPNGSTAPPQLLPQQSLIKPDDIQRIPNFSDENRAKYFEGVTKLWATIHALPKEHEAHQGAHRRLTEVTQQIRIHLRKTTAQSNPGGVAPTAQASAPQDARPLSQQAVPPGGAQLQITPKVAQAAMSLSLVVPPNYVAQGPETVQRWIKEAKQKYAQQLQRFETYSAQLTEINQLVEARRQEGKNFTDQEKQELSRRKANADAMRNQARQFIMNFKQQQEQYKAANLGTNGSAPPPDGSAEHNIQASNVENVESKPISQEPQPRQQPEHQGQAHTVSSALDAARQHASAMSPPNVQSNQSSASQGAGPQNPQIKKEPSTSQYPLHITTDGGPQNSQHNSPHVGQPPAASSQGPHPLSHQAAMASAAQRYTQQKYQQQATPSSTTHAHPPMPNRADPQNNNVKFPIPKDLKVSAPQPVNMGPARPTLTGGPSNGAPGPMGLPAIHRHPGYVLEGEGDRVLSKKRLQQLMREVTGASEGDDAEVMAPDVEETLLQVADDFVDQVISSACKLAKLRQSSQLEIRDLQIILERNYNIRVPGYASDELRTVKKIQPTQAWTQKLSAVQAAKVTGGKADV